MSYMLERRKESHSFRKNTSKICDVADFSLYLQQRRKDYVLVCYHSRMYWRSYRLHGRGKAEGETLEAEEFSSEETQFHYIPRIYVLRVFLRTTQSAACSHQGKGLGTVGGCI